ncbi:MAG: hypothetical protein IJG00_00790 [Clostridia bacterium]|nr:hypothetical protein [Clostridia bacterium]
MKKNLKILALLLLAVAPLVGCTEKNTTNEQKTAEISNQTIESTEQTAETENIKITIDKKYEITTGKEFYKPSMRISKSKEEYVSVQQLKNGNEKIQIPSDGLYTNENLKKDFQNYISGLTGFTEVKEVTIGEKTLFKTTTAVNAVDSDIYKTLTNSNKVYKIVVSGPDFKDTDEAAKIIEKLELN